MTYILIAAGGILIGGLLAIWLVRKATEDVIGKHLW